MPNYFDPKLLELEDARQRLVQYGHLSQYKSGVKSILRKELIKILVKNSSEQGSVLFNPEYSDEVIQFLEQRDTPRYKVHVIECDERTANNLIYVYNDLGVPVIDATFRDYIGWKVGGKFSAAHFDFCGEFNSPRTETHSINQSLKGRLTDQACLAYTHSASYRSCPPAFEFGRALSLEMVKTFPEFYDYLDFFQLRKIDQNFIPRDINNILWFNPSVLSWASNVLTHHETHQVELIDSCIYRQLSKTTAKPTRGNVYINRGIIGLQEGQFDIHKSIDSLLKNNRRKIN